MSADDPQAPPDAAGRRPVDAVALRRLARRMAAAKPEPWLHGEISRRMAERLPLIKSRPERVLIWGGGGHRDIAGAYAEARARPGERPGARRSIEFLGADPALDDEGRAGAAPGAVGAAQAGVGPLGALRRWLGGAGSGGGRRLRSIPSSQVQGASVGLVWSNMALHLQPNPLAIFRQWHRALAVEGFVMFSTLGPGSLPQLRRLYEQAGWGPAMAPLVDMHDLGDMLVQAGFADPVMDQETLVLGWADAPSALRELRSLGANTDRDRHAGLRTPRWRTQLLQALHAAAGADGRISLSFEIAYGHAFRPPERARLQPETRIALQDMRAMVRPPSGSGGGAR